MRKLGMKRSFHSIDLPSIASFEQDASSSGEESSMPNHWAMKRRRAVSADSSFSPPGRWVDDNDIGNTVLQTAVDAFSYSNVQLVSSSLSSHVAVVTPMPTSNLPIDEVVSSSTCLPYLNSGRRCPRHDKDDTTTLSATAALDRFMLQRRGSNLSILLDDQDDDDCPIAFKIGSTDLGDSCPSSSSTWLNFYREHELSSPRQVHDFPLEEDVSSRRSSVSVACSPPPMTKTTTCQHQHEPPTLSWRRKEVCSDSDVAYCVAAPSMEFHPVKSFALQPRINVNQLTEALARL